jgi:glucosamine-6-phosphate deaminase
MQLERHPDAQAVAARAADLVAETLRATDLVAETLRAKPDAVLCLPAGSTPVPLYEELVRRCGAGLDLGRTRLFQLDELRGVSRDDPRGFNRFLRDALVRPLGLEACFHGLDGAAPDPAAEIERHRRELAAAGAPDLVLLGLGRNGHVAFNEPGSASADAARVVALGPETLAGLRVHFGPDCPREGLTLGLHELAAAARIVMLVTGAAKRDVLARLLAGPPLANAAELPAAHLARHPRFVVLADEAAAPHAARAGS